jgi:hypothetical protein
MQPMVLVPVFYRTSAPAQALLHKICCQPAQLIPPHLHAALVRLLLEGDPRLLERLARGVNITAIEGDVAETVLFLSARTTPLLSH